MLSAKQVDSILTSLSDSPFLLSTTFINVLTNALCTTSRIKNHPTLKCFACGKYRDDLYHFLRCPYVAFIFKLPPAFGSLHLPYFSISNLAKISILFETYYIVMKQYGVNFLGSEFAFKAHKISNLATHVAIKNKLSRLSHTSIISYEQANAFCHSCNDSSIRTCIIDAASW